MKTLYKLFSTMFSSILFSIRGENIDQKSILDSPIFWTPDTTPNEELPLQLGESGLKMSHPIETMQLTKTAV